MRSARGTILLAAVATVGVEPMGLPELAAQEATDQEASGVVSVQSMAIIEVLRAVYGAGALADELRGIE